MSFAPDLPLVPVFTTREVLEHGLPPSRVRRSDVLRLARGIHRRRDMPLRTWESAGLPPPHHGVGLDLLTALLRSRPDGAHDLGAAHLDPCHGPRPGALRRRHGTTVHAARAVTLSDPRRSCGATLR